MKGNSFLILDEGMDWAPDLRISLWGFGFGFVVGEGRVNGWMDGYSALYCIVFQCMTGQGKEAKGKYVGR